MRWDDLFADLEGQLATALDRESAGLDLEEERLRLARLSLRERLAVLGSAQPAGLTIQLVSGASLRLALRSSGRDWLAGELATPPGASMPSGASRPSGAPMQPDAARRSVIVPEWSIATVSLVPDAVPDSLATPGSEQLGESLAARLGIAFVLRELCRRRALVELDTVVGGFTGTIDRVGRDHLDLAEHEPGVPRRASAVRRIRIVAFPALLAVRSRAG